MDRHPQYTKTYWKKIVRGTVKCKVHGSIDEQKK